ncbi:MAG TPA: prolipoprotein diacylglyceryl transferase [Oligoflexus sp.]|uniref:prolipoprotein diacylglyceryl transferase n=1 Tax=Oligoflexus sp. TaxID=1971216 RepID=UPI002D7F0153|nr:prolipoprotein diacylglyceryl transferase [Oligoflexus sp.]HET9238703.1 prolipoprotein diacylglyceryl transferase [Oligoflexus sp.]
MHPILFQWGSFVVPSWHAFFVLAALMGWWTLGLWGKLAWPEGQARSLDSLFLIAYIAGYTGARGLSIILEGESLSGFFELGSMTLYGGILLAAFAAILYAHWKKLSIIRLADLTLPSLMLGIAIGRIGCFLNGDDYGLPLPNQSEIPFWAVKFPNLNDELYRYPVQLIEAAVCLTIAGYSWSKRTLLKRRPGEIGTIGIVGYAITRFVLEFYRGDDRGQIFTDYLSPAQIISILVILAWAGVLVFMRYVAASGKQGKA